MGHYPVIFLSNKVFGESLSLPRLFPFLLISPRWFRVLPPQANYFVYIIIHFSYSNLQLFMLHTKDTGRCKPCWHQRISFHTWHKPESYKENSLQGMTINIIQMVVYAILFYWQKQAKLHLKYHHELWKNKNYILIYFIFT